MSDQFGLPLFEPRPVEQSAEVIRTFLGVPDPPPLLCSALKHHVFEDARKEVKRSLTNPDLQAALNKPRIKRNETIECWRERPFELMRSGDWISGPFDRVVIVYGPGRIPLRATILEVKTDAAENESDTARRADHYGPQLANYRHSIPQLLGLPADRITTILLFTKLGLEV